MTADVVMLPFSTSSEIAAVLPRVIEQLRADLLIAFATETVYGFGGAVTPAAATALSELKRRDPVKPFLLLVAGPDQAPGVHWSETARRVAQLFWPGPLTLVMPAEKNAYPAGVTGADGTVALRSSPHPGVQALVGAWGAPLTSSSANAPGQPPARTGVETVAALRALAVDNVLVLDSGALPASQSSTIVRCGDSVVRVLRQGAVSVAVLRERLQGVGIDVE